MSGGPDTAGVRAFLLQLQDEICAALEAEDGEARFRRDVLEGERGGLARPRILEDGPVIERSGVNFSHARGEALPPAASERWPELAGRAYEALSLSLIVHPRNPFCPTSHMNVRFFIATAPDAEPVWWFGGGFDLTPYYGFEEDARFWHETARDACAPFGEDVYPRLKEWCDRYFFLKHRGEPRGIGGLFFDDWSEGGFERSYGLWRSVGEHFLRAYRPILARRKDMPWGERERDFQLYRRGRGTLFGLQAGGRTESILASLPPLVRWRYDWRPEPGSEEARLHEEFLRPRDWVV